MGILKTLGVSTSKEKKLMERGIALNAVIRDIAVNNSVTVNGQNPRKLVCEGMLPNGITKYFESGNVSPYIQPDVIGRYIKVYLDPQDFNRYYVDASMYK